MQILYPVMFALGTRSSTNSNHQQFPFMACVDSHHKQLPHAQIQNAFKKKLLLEDLWALRDSALLFTTLPLWGEGGLNVSVNLRVFKKTLHFLVHVLSLFHVFNSTQIIMMMLLAEQRKFHFPAVVFHSSHHSIMEEETSIYSVPQHPNRNAGEGRCLRGFEVVPAVLCPFASP